MTASEDVAAPLGEQRDLRGWRQARGHKGSSTFVSTAGCGNTVTGTEVTVVTALEAENWQMSPHTCS